MGSLAPGAQTTVGRQRAPCMLYVSGMLLKLDASETRDVTHSTDFYSFLADSRAILSDVREAPLATMCYIKM